MRKKILLILILTLLLAPLVMRADDQPIFVDDGGLGTGDLGNLGNDPNRGGPSGYTFCANENQRCNFSGTKDVAYGLNTTFNYKDKVVDGIDCNNSTFGDPKPNVVKACYIKDSISSSVSSSSSSILSVETSSADNITQTTATLYGKGGYSSLGSNLSSDGVWSSTDGGRTGTWSTATDSGTWTANLLAGLYLLGTPGTGTATWTGTGNGTGTWRKSGLFSGSGTWTNGKGTGGAGTGTWTNGTGTTDPTIPPVTAYFRYAKAKNNPPIFCNDIYGTNMIATGDIFLGTTYKKDTYQNDYDSSKKKNLFSQQITGLSPNTTYYYCAILSNKDAIAYGGSQVVKEFHTNCYDTTVETKDPAVNVRSTSASLKGVYCSPKNNFVGTVTNNTVTTYFEYKKATFGGGPGDGSSGGSAGNGTPEWIKVGEQTPYSMGNNANLYGNISANLSGLTPDTTYQFRAVVKNNAGKSNETIHYGSPSVSFTTIPSSGGSNTGGSGCTSCVKLLPTVTVIATPSSIKPGESSTISWESANVNTCSVIGDENIDETAGSFNTGALTSSKSYSVTCTGPNGTKTGSVYVFVNTGSGSGNNLFPTVTVKATPSSIAPGGSSIISWTSTNATACTSADNIDIDETAGSFSTGILTNSKSYTITCVGAQGRSSGNAYVYVNTGGGGYTPQCSDTLDNDKDGKIDNLDPNCYQDGDLTKNYLPNHYSEATSSVYPYNPNNPNDPNSPYNPNNPNSPYNPNNPNYNPNNPNPYNPNDPNNPFNKGTWGPVGGSPGAWTSGTWGTGTDSGTWRTTSGTGGTGIVYWAGNGDGTGTWYSTTGNGTWTNGRKSGSSGTGTWTNLILGQTATPPWDAIVRYHEGIETVFIRQIIKNPIFTQRYGYVEGMNLQTFAEDLADQFARAFGYVNTNGREIRVGPPDIAAYQLQLIGNKLTVYEYYDNKIIDIRSTTATFKNASGYEYYFKK